MAPRKRFNEINSRKIIPKLSVLRANLGNFGRQCRDYLNIWKNATNKLLEADECLEQGFSTRTIGQNLAETISGSPSRNVEGGKEDGKSCHL